MKARAVLAVPLVTALLLTLFDWPSARLKPLDLPIGVAGGGPAADAIEHPARRAGRTGIFGRSLAQADQRPEIATQ
jgi:hypothetical protein